MPNNVHLYGAYKDRKQKDGEERMAVPQQFTFIRRQGWKLGNVSIVSSSAFSVR